MASILPTESLSCLCRGKFLRNQKYIKQKIFKYSHCGDTSVFITFSHLSSFKVLMMTIIIRAESLAIISRPLLLGHHILRTGKLKPLGRGWGERTNGNQTKDETQLPTSGIQLGSSSTQLYPWKPGQFAWLDQASFCRGSVDKGPLDVNLTSSLLGDDKQYGPVALGSLQLHA